MAEGARLLAAALGLDAVVNALGWQLSFAKLTVTFACASSPRGSNRGSATGSQTFMAPGWRLSQA